MDNEEIVLTFAQEMVKATPDDYLQIKLCMLAANQDNPAVVKLLQCVFEIAERRRPLLIEMKGGVV